MKSKPLSKSAAERFEKFLNKKDSLLEKLDDKWTDLIEDTWLDKPYHYVYRKFKWGWWNPRTCYFMVKSGVENLITYFNVIWNDRDWEYNSWLILNEKKLGRMIICEISLLEARKWILVICIFLEMKKVFLKSTAIELPHLLKVFEKTQ